MKLPDTLTTGAAFAVFGLAVVGGTPAAAQAFQGTSLLSPPIVGAQSTSYACTTSGVCTAPVTFTQVSSTTVSSSQSANGGSASASATVPNLVYLQSSSNGSTVGDTSPLPYAFSSGALVAYEIEVNPGTSGYDSGLVPVIVQANLGVTAFANLPGTYTGAAGGAVIALLNGSTTIGAASVCILSIGAAGYSNCGDYIRNLDPNAGPDNDSPYGGSSTESIDATVYLPVNTPITVEEGVGTSGFGPQTSALAWADPYFQIDPTFLLDNPGLQFSVSDGVANIPPPVPEPASWALMLLGFGGLGAALRARRDWSNCATGPSRLHAGTT